MRRRYISAFALSTLLASCEKVDKVLEGHVAPNAHLSIAVAPTPLSVVQGSEATVTATVTRVGDFQGAVTVSAENLPAGVTADIGTSPTGQITTATIRLHIAGDVKVGSYLLT